MKHIIFTTTVLGLLLLFSIGSFTQDAEIMSDVNGDGVVNILDLVLVASQFGKVATQHRCRIPMSMATESWIFLI